MITSRHKNWQKTRSQSCMSVQCSRFLSQIHPLHSLVWKIKIPMDKLMNSWLQYGVCHTRGDVILLTSTFNIQPMIRSLSTSNKVPRADLFVQSTTAASLCTVGGGNEYVQTISGLCQNLSPDTLCLSLWMHYILLLQIIKFECEAPIKQSSHKYTHCTQIFMHTHTHARVHLFLTVWIAPLWWLQFTSIFSFSRQPQSNLMSFAQTELVALFRLCKMCGT